MYFPAFSPWFRGRRALAVYGAPGGRGRDHLPRPRRSLLFPVPLATLDGQPGRPPKRRALILRGGAVRYLRRTLRHGVGGEFGVSLGGLVVVLFRVHFGGHGTTAVIILRRVCLKETFAAATTTTHNLQMLYSKIQETQRRAELYRRHPARSFARTPHHIHWFGLSWFVQRIV